VRQQCRRGLCVNGKDTLLPLVLEIGLQLGPDRFGFRRRRRKKFLVTSVWRDVADDEIPHIDRSPPVTRVKPSPWVLIASGFDFFFFCKGGTTFHGDFSLLADVPSTRWPFSKVDQRCVNALT
jgi:hypothetical protein